MDKKQLEEPQSEAEAFLRLVFDATFDAVLISRENGVISYASPNVAAMFGVDPGKTDPAGNLFSLFGAVFFNREELKKSGRIDNLEYRFRKNGLEERTLRVNLRWGACGGGTVLCCCRDITECRKAEQVLRDDARMKDAFIAAAGHELRTPLTAIQGYAELLLQQRDIDTEDRQQALNVIFEKAQQLSQIIDDLLDLGRTGTEPGAGLRKSMVEARSLVERVVGKARLKTAMHRLDQRLPESSVRLLVDETRMERVLLKLLDNAVKYSPPNGWVTLCGQQQGGDFLFLIEDEGIGMTFEQKEKVFDKFYRADGSNTAVPGLGLGMSLARKIIEEHGGNIWLESTTGKGTRVFFTVPMAGEQTSDV